MDDGSASWGSGKGWRRRRAATTTTTTPAPPLLYIDPAVRRGHWQRCKPKLAWSVCCAVGLVVCTVRVVIASALESNFSFLKHIQTA
ncbi:uncharacterized protein H6S33_006580 [Morchella sextelata]|uniref:uncharacterized protein n=1 Tax=Morchella sextelata TaxID=1174677 RepID=UPI001D0541CA|nr:uncharacterized protein H6S33_006580 [Morchella sextelata]KAH0604912.1 hypothetical protein H6S33_006580 [Morchella sextelata]